jgi:hypothetical protein
MASTPKQERASKRYYEKNKKYREKKIENQIQKQKANKPETNKYHRDYYADNEDYRKYKRAYAKKYRKENPEKSKARKDRKAYK